MKIRSKTKKIICFTICMLAFVIFCVSFVFMETSSASSYLFILMIILLFIGTYGFNKYIVKNEKLPYIKFKNNRVRIVSTDLNIKTVYEIYYSDIVSAIINPKGCLVIIFKTGGKSGCTCSKKGKTKEKITHAYVSPPIPAGSELEEYILNNPYYEVVMSKRFYKRYLKRVNKIPIKHPR